MRKLILFAILLPGLTAFGQTLSPAADGHILRNQTFVFSQADPSVTYGGQTTYFNYFQNLYVGGGSFTADFDTTDGKATHYNRELRTIIEFDISSLHVTPGNYSATLNVTTDGNFFPTDPTLTVKAYDEAPANQDGSITQSDYAAAVGTALGQASMDAQNFGKTYSFNITSALDSDLTNSRTYSGFILIADPRNGNEISLVSSWEAANLGEQGKPQLVVTSVQPDITVTFPGTCTTVVGTQNSIPITVQNTGQANLVISSVSELSDASNYFVADLTGFSTTLAPGASSTFHILFSPAAAGTFDARYRIASNDPSHNPYDFDVSCTGTSAPTPSLQVTADPCTQISLGATETVNVKLTNGGNATLTIGGVTKTSDPSAVYSLDLSGMAASLAPGASTQFKILFSPTAPGTFAGAFQIASNDPVHPTTEVDLNCTAVASNAPEIQVDPSSVVCSGLTPNQQSLQVITVRNVTESGGDLVLASFIMGGDSVYTLDVSQTKLTLHPGEQTTCTVKVLASATGFYQGQLVINSNDPATPSVTVTFACAVTLSGVQNQAVTLPDASAALLIPASALASGAYNSFWVTDLRIHNPGTSPVPIALYYLPTQAVNTTTLAAGFSIPPSATLAIPNVLKNLYGLTTGVGALLIVPTSPTNAHLLAVSRTYNQTSNGTYGQFVPGVPVSGFIGVGQTSNLLGLGKSAHMRTNTGFASGANGATLTLTLMQGNAGTPLGSPYVVTLGANSHTQLSDIFAYTGATAQEDVFAVISVTSGSAFAYASVVDNDTSDPIFIPMR